MTDAQWQVIENKLPEQMVKRKRDYPLRSIFDAIFYLLKTVVFGGIFQGNIHQQESSITILKYGEIRV